MALSQIFTTRRMGSLPVVLAAVTLMMCGIGNSSLQAAEVLVNGNLESSVAPVGWSLTTSITGLPGATLSSVVEHVDGANNPPPPAAGLGLLLHPQKGNQGIYVGQDKMVNLVLEQTFGSIALPAVVGRTYTFTGDVFLQDGYSGIVDTLNPITPLGDYNLDTVVNAADFVIWRDTLGSTTDFRANGTNEGASLDLIDQADYDYWKSKFGNSGRGAIPSPTETTFEITFLNSSNVELGTTVYDLRDDPTTLTWRTGTDKVVAVAPPGTAKARVRVSALNMVDNCCALGQDVLFDNFRLSDNVAPAANRLTNGNLNIPGEPAGWTVTEGPTVDQGNGPVTADSLAFIGFANRLSNIPNPNPVPPFATLPTGQQGLWLRPYVNVTQFEPDIAEVFGQASQVVPGTPGAEYTFSAWSAWESGYCGGLLNTSTDTFMTLEFLNGSMAVIGTETLDLLTAGQVSDDNSGANENGGNVEFDDWRQFSLNAVAPAGTANVRVSLGATGMFLSSLGFESGFFDEMSLIETLPGVGVGGATAVPEPGSVVLVGIAVALAGAVRRRGR